MKKEDIMIAIRELKRFFTDKDISYMLSQLISCKRCPFKISCDSSRVSTCQKYFLGLVKNCKTLNQLFEEACADLTNKINSFSKGVK